MASLLLLLVGVGPAECRRPSPPAVPLQEAEGSETATFDAMVSAAEAARGLAFIRRPTLVLVDPGDPLPEAADHLSSRTAAEPPPGPAPVPAAWIERDTARIFASRPVQAEAVRHALGRLLDAQQFPHLADLATRLEGDPGLAVRALLEASARATASGHWFRGGASEPIEPLASIRARIEQPEEFAPLALDDAADVAPVLLLQLEDPNLAFRRPPLSTLQLLSPAAYHSSRPLRLEGAPPPLDGCQIQRDESYGALRLLHEAARRGLGEGDDAIAAWRGDRLVRYACEDGRAPWLYVIELQDEASAIRFAPRVEARLPGSLARPSKADVAGRRVVAWHGLAAARALACGRRLVSREIAELDGFLD